jgi:3-methyladenine DNA glycosylase AlkD
MSSELSEIQKVLKEKSNEKVKASFQKFIPSSQKVYGVKVLELNKLAMKYKNGRFEIVKELWSSGSFEEKLLASKILGKICKEDPEKRILPYRET